MTSFKIKSAFTGRSQYTQTKQEHLNYFLDTHIRIVNAINKKQAWLNGKYWYADICAGDGGDDTPGSPLIFSKLQKKYNLDCEPYFIERVPKLFGKLTQKLDNDFAKCFCEDHSKILPKLIPVSSYLGLLYFDPNGDPFHDYPNLLPNFFSQRTSTRIDLLLYYSGTTIKRVLKSSKTNRTWDLSKDITRINKKYWLIREPQGRAQWSFLFGTNWCNFPEFKKLGFFKTTSKKGQRILDKINYTAKELRQKKQDWFVLPEQQQLFPNFKETCI